MRTQGCGCIGHPAFPAPSGFQGGIDPISSGPSWPASANECLDVGIPFLDVFERASPHSQSSSPANCLVRGHDRGRSSTPGRLWSIRDAAAYWIPRMRVACAGDDSARRKAVLRRIPRQQCRSPSPRNVVVTPCSNMLLRYLDRLPPAHVPLSLRTRHGGWPRIGTGDQEKATP